MDEEQKKKVAAPKEGENDVPAELSASRESEDKARGSLVSESMEARISSPARPTDSLVDGLEITDSQKDKGQTESVPKSQSKVEIGTISPATVQMMMWQAPRTEVQWPNPVITESARPEATIQASETKKAEPFFQSTETKPERPEQTQSVPGEKFAPHSSTGVGTISPITLEMWQYRAPTGPVNWGELPVSTNQASVSISGSGEAGKSKEDKSCDEADTRHLRNSDLDGFPAFFKEKYQQTQTAQSSQPVDKPAANQQVAGSKTTEGVPQAESSSNALLKPESGGASAQLLQTPSSGIKDGGADLGALRTAEGRGAAFTQSSLENVKGETLAPAGSSLREANQSGGGGGLLDKGGAGRVGTSFGDQALLGKSSTSDSPITSTGRLAASDSDRISARGDSAGSRAGLGEDSFLKSRRADDSTGASMLPKSFNESTEVRPRAQEAASFSEVLRRSEKDQNSRTTEEKNWDSVRAAAAASDAAAAERKASGRLQVNESTIISFATMARAISENTASAAASVVRRQSDTVSVTEKTGPIGLSEFKAGSIFRDPRSGESPAGVRDFKVCLENPKAVSLDPKASPNVSRGLDTVIAPREAGILASRLESKGESGNTVRSVELGLSSRIDGLATARNLDLAIVGRSELLSARVQEIGSREIGIKDGVAGAAARNDIAIKGALAAFGTKEDVPAGTRVGSANIIGKVEIVGSESLLQGSERGGRSQTRVTEGEEGGDELAEFRALLKARSAARGTEKRYLTGVEIALAAAIAAAAIAKSREEKEHALSQAEIAAKQLRELMDDDMELATPDDETSNANGRLAFPNRPRPLYLIAHNDTLIGLAEHFYNDSAVAWLIADLNAGRVTEHIEDGRRIVELRTRQEIELPLWDEVHHFLRHSAKDFNPENLVTIINETEVDRELLDSFLSTVIGVTQQTSASAESVLTPLQVQVVPVLTADAKRISSPEPSILGFVSFTRKFLPTMERLKKAGLDLKSHISAVDTLEKPKSRLRNKI